jgi:hypothetical protein
LLHLVFDRARENLKVFGPTGFWRSLKAEGDAWGYTPENPYATDGWMPPGHYILGAMQRFDPPIASEGYGQIPVLDLASDVVAQLVHAGKATWSGLDLIVGGIAGKVGQLSVYGRSGIMVHCGGSNASNPFADYQELCKTFGCTRTYNLEWRELADWLDANRQGNTVVYSAVGNPVRLPK